MDNVVTVVFNVESEAYQAFANLRNKPIAEGYVVAEAALVKREGNALNVADSFDAAGVTADDTATGMIVGSLVGILGGPVGVLLGAGIGALAGGVLDSNDAIDSVSMLEATAVKLYDGEAAIIALVQEDEPAFDAAFEGFGVTITRRFAVDVFDEVERAREVQEQLANEAKAQLRAEKKAAREEKREERRAKLDARFEAAKAKRAERKETMDEAKEIANAQYTSATKEMLSE